MKSYRNMFDNNIILHSKYSKKPFALSSKKMNNQSKNDQKTCITKRRKGIENKYMKRYSVSLVTCKMQITTTMEQYYIKLDKKKLARTLSHKNYHIIAMNIYNLYSTSGESLAAHCKNKHTLTMLQSSSTLKYLVQKDTCA